MISGMHWVCGIGPHGCHGWNRGVIGQCGGMKWGVVPGFCYCIVCKSSCEVIDEVFQAWVLVGICVAVV